MINIFEVNETNKMIEQENLDVRTITMGISLLDCIDSDLDIMNEKIYNKITTKAKDLVATGDKIAAEFGIPVVNKRVSVTPIALIGGVACHTTEDFVSIAKTLDRAAKTIGVNFIGGYSALVCKGMTPAEELLIRSIPQALAVTERVCSSVNVGSTKTGINMDAVKLMGEIVLETAEASKEQDSLGCAKLVVFCNAPDDNPFMAGAFHGVTEADCIINVGVSGPGVVKTALESVRGADFQTLCEMIKRTAFKVTRVGQLVAQEASRRLNVPFGIVDLSLAPTPAIGDSVAEILEEIGLERVGAPGTTAALALLNDQVKKGGVMAAQAVGGLSGAFIPVSEDQGMIDSVNLGALTLEKLEAMTCVCSVGLDMIAIPGDTKASTIAGIIADESVIGMINQKTTAVRVIPVIGKGVGETVEFGGLLGYAPIMPVNKFSCDAFVERGGRIPAPIHSFKN
ncbi:PFL family protein [Ruminococcus sp. AF17-22AC]|uniref:PFL family protein n=1 Tax=Ruminococcus sp. AF17-22AC TaxID=2292248 RepID=UPI000E46AED0|nr:PFL family protein [Ruminococcus sp. AF17-22AC]RGU34775.1 PFL family protein [Ruminococcus sp. AF17-22AC]